MRVRCHSERSLRGRAVRAQASQAADNIKAALHEESTCTWHFVMGWLAVRGPFSCDVCSAAWRGGSKAVGPGPQEDCDN